MYVLAPQRVYDTASLELAIRGAPGLICFALKITRIGFRRAESQALAAGSSAREFSLIDVASVTPEPFGGARFHSSGLRLLTRPDGC